MNQTRPQSSADIKEPEPGGLKLAKGLTIHVEFSNLNEAILRLPHDDPYKSVSFILAIP